MDFAREHLKQLGWQEGDGLGSARHGITEALKPKLKFDNAGVGHDPAKEFTCTWWSEAYNSAAGNITVTEATDGCQLVAKPKKKKKKEKKTPKSTYRNFVTGGLLVGDQVAGSEGADGEPVEQKPAAEDAAASRLSDDQLLAACGGRTAHKGARHGHKMNGKLARIMAQEAAILARLGEGKGGEETVTKKKRKRAEVEDSHSADTECEVSITKTDGLKTEKKKKKKKRSDSDAVDMSTNDENCVDDLVSEKKKKRKRKTERESC